MGKESKLEEELRLYIKSLGGLCLKWVSPGFTGVPDRIILLRGNIWFVELKAPNGRLSDRQVYVRDQEFAPRLIDIYYVYDDYTLNQFKNAICPA